MSITLTVSGVDTAKYTSWVQGSPISSNHKEPRKRASPKDKSPPKHRQRSSERKSDISPTKQASMLREQRKVTIGTSLLTQKKEERKKDKTSFQRSPTRGTSVLSFRKSICDWDTSQDNRTKKRKREPEKKSKSHSPSKMRKTRAEEERKDDTSGEDSIIDCSPVVVCCSVIVLIFGRASILDQ